MNAPISIKEFVDIVKEAGDELIDRANDDLISTDDLTEDELFVRAVDNLQYSYHIKTGTGVIAPWINEYWESDMVKYVIGDFLERACEIPDNSDDDPYEWGRRC